MQTNQYIWQNGTMVPFEDAKTHVLSHSLHYGSGVFEGIRFYKTEQGPAIFKLVEHVDRLFYSASVLKMPISYSKEEVCEAIKQVVKKNDLNQGYIRPLMYYGQGHLKLEPSNLPLEFIIACWPWGAYLSNDPIDIKTSSFIRIHSQSTVSDAKLSGNYINSILASLELRGTKYKEALLLDADGFIAEGPGENFFIVNKDVIYTPGLGNILSGITRATVISLARDLGYRVVQTKLTLEQAYSADEAFFTGTAAEVTAIRSINDHVFLPKTEVSVTSKIKNAYLDVVYGKNLNYINDLYFI